MWCHAALEYCPMKRSIAALAIMLGWILTGCRSEPPPKIAASPRTHDSSFKSVSLGRIMKYRVLLPSGYEQGALRYPVLYLLHGLGGDSTEWTEYSHIVVDTDSLPLLVVMPEAGESWYVNSATRPQDRYEDYIISDLIREIDTKYRTVSTREARAIAGASMGGYGAVKLGLKYPGKFAFAGSFGGALEVTRGNSADVLEAFGPSGSATREDNDVFALVQKQPEQELPYFWLTCGDADGNAAGNGELAAIFQQRKVPHNYLEPAGGHDGKLWDAQLPAMLNELSRHTELSAKPAPAPAPLQKERAGPIAR